MKVTASLLVTTPTGKPRGLLRIETDAISSDSKDVDRGVEITTDRQAAHGTLMDAGTQIFRNQLSTPRTAFAGVARVNLHHATTSFFRFAGHDVCKLMPRGVSNTFRKTVVTQHPAYIQIFKADRSEPTYQFTGFLMGKGTTAIGSPFVDVGDDLAAFGVLRRSLLGCGQAALCLCQRPFIGTKEARIGDLFAIRQRSELFQPNVNANGGLRYRLWLRFGFNTERHKPPAGTAAPNRDRLDRAVSGTVQNNLDRSDFTQDQMAPFQPSAISVLRIGQAIVAPGTLEARVSGLLARLDAAKERLERQINARTGVLQHLTMHELQGWAFGFPLWEEVDRIVQANGFLPFFPRLFARGKGFVIDPTGRVQHPVQDADLSLGWIQSVLVRLPHRTIVLHFSAAVKQGMYVHKHPKRLMQEKGFYPTA
jgi:hypothetical protein